MEAYTPADFDSARLLDYARARRAAPTVSSASTMQAWPTIDPSAAPFRYIGAALTPLEFKQYCLDFKASGQLGAWPPSYWIWHHTYNPDASWAPISSTSQSTWWDRNESGMTVEQKKSKRKPQLDGIMRYYRDSLGWTVGPHFFVDDLFIWLMTSMYDVGIHANEGNSYYLNGQLRYSMGCEVIGQYDTQKWPTTIYKMAGWACACVKAILGYENRYTSAGEDRPDLHDLQLSGHRDYSEKTCPGNAITNDFFVQAAVDGWAAYQSNTPPWETTNSGMRARTVNGPPSERAYYCSTDTAQYYETCGGFARLGYALADEYTTTDNSGAVRRVFWTERGDIKDGRELALLLEVADRGWHR